MKKCIICNVSKELEEFYVHKKMTDGHINKCKTCTKLQAKEREKKLKNNPDWVEKERTRQREKRHRLGYKDKYKPTKEEKRKAIELYKEQYPEKAKAFALSNHIKFPKGIEKHHWSYRIDDVKDIIPLDSKTHKFLHRFIKYDQSTFLYKDKEGNLLDTKEKHEEYLQSLLDNHVEVVHEKIGRSHLRKH